MGIKIGNTDISKIKIASGLTPRLPSAYQEVEWIGCDSSGPYIDTGVLPKDSTLSQIKFMNLAVTGYVIYGMYNGDDNSSYRLFNYQSTIYFDLKDRRTYTGTGNTLNPNTLYEFEVGNNYVKNVGASSNLITGTTVSSYTGNINILLNGNNSGNISRNRWYYVKIWEGATQVRDFVPCYRIADDVIGMYDLVTDTFYTNSGTGSFTKGSDVITSPYKEISKVYLGSTQVRPAYSEFDISANLSSSSNYYNLNLTGIPTKIELTYTSNHASGWSDQVLGLYANNVGYRFNCGDGQNFNLDRCWIQTFQNGAEVGIVQDKYQSTGTWQTVLTFEVNSCSVQQGNAAAVIGTPNASQQTAISGLFADYSNLSLRAYGNNSTLTSDVHVKVRY